MPVLGRGDVGEAFGMARFADTPARSVLNVTRLAAAMW